MDDTADSGTTCPHCRAPNPSGAKTCVACGKDFAGGVDADVTAERSATLKPSRTAIPGSASYPLSEGLELGSRYEVVRPIGKGGMGTVYLVRDRGLNREVALKVIRSDIAEDPVALERFRREIQLASQVTHKNVLRVYDLGESDGLKFLTMQYVEGDNLAGLIKREGRLPLPRLLSILRQICAGLAAAHEQGVIHRDLKPQNIMVDARDNVYLTDFGLAKLQEQTGVTETGALVGTPSYMSPEQVKGAPLDHRSDIYSLGVILYELATGRVPFSGGSAYEVMMRRLHTAPPPIAELNPDIPRYLRGILERCMATDRELRYSRLDEMLADLDSAEFRSSFSYKLRRRQRWLRPAVAVVVVVALGLLGYGLSQRRSTERPVAGRPQSILIADFDNRTGDAVFDATLEPALGVALEGASFITSYSRASARRIAAQLQPGASRLDEGLARLVAGREGVSVVAAGFVERRGGGYGISVRALDAVTGKPLVTAETEVAGKEAVLASVTKLAARVRKALGDTTPESAQIAAAETFTAASLEAAHAYAQGQEAQWAGKWEEAIHHYSKAVELDPNLGRAYAGLAVVENNRGRRGEAEKYYRLAMSRIDRMSEREKYRTRGAYYLVISRNPDNAIEELSALVSKYPADNAGHANLAVAYQLKRDFARALEEGRRAIEIYPTVPQRNNVGLFAMYGGDFEAAIREQQKVLEMNPRFVTGYSGLALAQLAAGQAGAARETWKKLEQLGPEGASATATGLADLALYEGRAGEARSLLQNAVERDLAAEDPEAAAVKLTMLAEADLLEGRPAQALAAAERARTLSKTEAVAFSAGRVFVEAGDAKKAAAVAAQLEKSLEPEPQMYGRLIRGELELQRGAAREALAQFKEAQKLVDTWLGRYGLGRAYLAAGAFTEAHAQLEACLQRRGETTDLFLSIVPTYHALPPLYYHLGRAREGLKSPEASGCYKTFLEIKRDGADPLVGDARRRLASFTSN